jgi:hypothetical protein
MPTKRRRHSSSASAPLRNLAIGPLFAPLAWGIPARIRSSPMAIFRPMRVSASETMSSIGTITALGNSESSARAEHRPDRHAGYFHPAPPRPDHCSGGSVSLAVGLRLSPFSGERRTDVIGDRSCRSVSPRGTLRRPHPEGRETLRPSGADAHQIRVGGQSQDGQGPSISTCPCPSSSAPMR